MTNTQLCASAETFPLKNVTKNSSPPPPPPSPTSPPRPLPLQNPNRSIIRSLCLRFLDTSASLTTSKPRSTQLAVASSTPRLTRNWTSPTSTRTTITNPPTPRQGPAGRAQTSAKRVRTSTGATSRLMPSSSGSRADRRSARSGITRRGCGRTSEISWRTRRLTDGRRSGCRRR